MTEFVGDWRFAFLCILSVLTLFSLSISELLCFLLPQHAYTLANNRHRFQALCIVLLYLPSCECAALNPQHWLVFCYRVFRSCLLVTYARYQTKQYMGG
ncbi:hypothetical protein BDW59DRAFT_60869 [Aspergillus cavernicola]|uniref:Secreted protein n=1 Tax=Aspergillus cavernicola TaxID=176166 RepID=A0ABR4IGB8_9EURO